MRLIWQVARVGEKEMKTTLSIIGIVVLGFFLITAAGSSQAGGGMHWSGASKHAMPVAKKATVSPPIMVSTDFLEYLEFAEGIETGSLTAPGVHATEIAGPSTRVEIPEGG
jgi:hypothetical protein